MILVATNMLVSFYDSDHATKLLCFLVITHQQYIEYVSLLSQQVCLLLFSLQDAYRATNTIAVVILTTSILHILLSCTTNYYVGTNILVFIVNILVSTLKQTIIYDKTTTTCIQQSYIVDINQYKCVVDMQAYQYQQYYCVNIIINNLYKRLQLLSCINNYCYTCKNR